MSNTSNAQPSLNSITNEAQLPSSSTSSAPTTLSSQSHDHQPDRTLPQIRWHNRANLQANLRDLLQNPDACFRDRDQFVALQTILDGSHDVLYIAPTGGGKSLMFQLSSVISQNCSVVVVPHKDLKEDMQRNCQQLSIHAEVWEKSKVFQDIPQVLIVQYEHAIEEDFRTFVTQRSNEIGRVFVDEAHVYLTDRQWRKQFEQAYKLGCYGKQVILLSATIMPIKERALLDCLNLSYDTTSIVRSETMRDDLHIAVQAIPRLQDYVTQLIQRLSNRLSEYRLSDKAMLFCNRISDVTAIVIALKNADVSAYALHAKMSNDDRHNNMTSWTTSGSL